LTTAFSSNLALTSQSQRVPTSSKRYTIVPTSSKGYTISFRSESRIPLDMPVDDAVNVQLQPKLRDSNDEFDGIGLENQRRTILVKAIAAMQVSLFSGLSEPKLAFASTDEPMECKNGAIMAESAVPGAYQQICMSLPTRSITLKSTGDVISVYQGITDDGNGNGANQGGSIAGRTGVAVWNSGILITRLLDLYAMEEEGFFTDKTVLELGCGTALASVAASKLGASRTIATDGNDEVIRLAKRNLEFNDVRGGEAALLKWGALDAIDYYGEADIVMGSDLTYNSGNWGVLSETLSTVLKPNGVAIYLTLGHSGFAVEGELGGFLTTVQSQGSLVWMKEDSAYLEKLLSKSFSKQDKDVIIGTGGFKVAVFRKKKRLR